MELNEYELNNLRQLLNSDYDLGIQIATANNVSWKTIVYSLDPGHNRILMWGRLLKILVYLLVDCGYKYYNISNYCNFEYHKDIINMCEHLQIRYGIYYLKDNKRKTDRLIYCYMEGVNLIKIDHIGYEYNECTMIDIEESIKLLLNLRDYGTD
jgi:hypothetical protein